MPAARRGVKKKQGENAIRNAIPNLVLGAHVVGHFTIKNGLPELIFTHTPVVEKQYFGG